MTLSTSHYNRVVARTYTHLLPQVVHHAHDTKELLIFLLVLLPLALLLGGSQLLCGCRSGHVGHRSVTWHRHQQHRRVCGLCLLLLHCR